MVVEVTFGSVIEVADCYFIKTNFRSLKVAFNVASSISIARAALEISLDYIMVAVT